VTEEHQDDLRPPEIMKRDQLAFGVAQAKFGRGVV